MAAWKFTDVYAVGYPALTNSILDVLVFDVSEHSPPVVGDRFSANLDLAATGLSMKILAALVGVNSIPMTGTVTSAGGVLDISLTPAEPENMLQALKDVPLIGGSLHSARLVIKNKTAASATAEDEPIEDTFNIDIELKIGSVNAKLVMQVPMSEGLFSIQGEFENLGISLSDLNFLVPGTDFSTMFPGDLPPAYYTPSVTSLNLLGLGLMLHITTSPSLSIDVSTVSTSIGIVNIPLYDNALYLNPLALQISVSSPFSNPVASWGLVGDICLYPHGKQTRPPSVAPDFKYELAAQMPTASNPTFSLSGTLENPADLPVSQILCDLMNDGSFNTGISSQLTLKQFDFSSEADSKSGTIDGFSVEIAMDASKQTGGYFGLFDAGFGVTDFSIAVSYTK